MGARPFRRRLLIVLVVTVAAAAAVTGLVWLARSAPSTGPQSWTAEDYVAAATTEDPLTDTAAGRPAAGWAKPPQFDVRVLPITSYLDLVGDVADGFLTDATVNPGTHVTAALIGTGPAARIYTARYLPEQTGAVLAAYQRSGSPVTVLPDTAGGVTAPVRGFGSPLHATRGDGTTPAWVYAIFGLMLVGFVVMIVRLIRRPGPSRRQRGGDESTRSGPVVSRPGAKTKKGETPPPDTRFDDVAGCDEAIEDLREIVAFLKQPDRYAATGAKPPNGALLVGPPGTGKTLLARATAGEAGVPFLSCSGADFVEMFVGIGPKRVRELFAQARKHNGPAVIFIDEVDAIGRARAGKGGHGHQEHENTLNALLVEMDGFTESSIVVLAATNRPDMLDDALTRPGRLDRQVHVPLPDVGGRTRILAVHATGVPLHDSVDLAWVARRTPGMSGAELAMVVNEAALVAARTGATVVTARDFDAAIATVTTGKARTSAVISDTDRQLTAWHEAGHAVAGLVQPDSESPASVSIIPRGHAGGITYFPAHDSGYLTRRQAYARLVTAMGGMAAERLLLGDGEFTTGPSGDLESASQIALAMVTQYGMGERLLVRTDALLGASGQVTDDAVAEADDLLRQALTDAELLLIANNALFTDLVTALLDRETLGRDDLDALIDGRQVATVTQPPAAPRTTPAAQTAAAHPVRSVAPGPGRHRAPVTGRLLTPVHAAARTFTTAWATRLRPARSRATG